MSDTSAGPPTEQREPEKWEGQFEEWVDCAKTIADRVSERAQYNVGLARRGQYNLLALLEDIRWFWGEVATEAAEVVDQIDDATDAGGSATGTPGGRP
jgi:hypothetical protein